jgi:hypothetical protein
VDREAGRRAAEANPAMYEGVRGNRAFLARSVRAGLVRAPEWRPDSPEDTANPAEMWGGVARRR